MLRRQIRGLFVIGVLLRVVTSPCSQTKPGQGMAKEWWDAPASDPRTAIVRYCQAEYIGCKRALEAVEIDDTPPPARLDDTSLAFTVDASLVVVGGYRIIAVQRVSEGKAKAIVEYDVLATTRKVDPVLARVATSMASLIDYAWPEKQRQEFDLSQENGVWKVARPNVRHVSKGAIMANVLGWLDLTLSWLSPTDEPYTAQSDSGAAFLLHDYIDREFSGRLIGAWSIPEGLIYQAKQLLPPTSSCYIVDGFQLHDLSVHGLTATATLVLHEVALQKIEPLQSVECPPITQRYNATFLPEEQERREILHLIYKKGRWWLVTPDFRFTSALAVWDQYRDWSLPYWNPTSTCDKSRYDRYLLERAALVRAFAGSAN